MTIEQQLKQEILGRYRSVRAFTTVIKLPYSTLDSVFKRGVAHAGLDTIFRIFGALNLDVESIRTGQLRHKTPRAYEDFSEESMRCAMTYEGLDRYGRDAVRELLSVEKARCEDEERLLRAAAYRAEPRLISLFEDASAAGLTVGVTGQNSVPYELGEDDPPNAAYAVRVRGDSMEPYFPDGSVAFVDHIQMRDGDVGIFNVDGAAVIKQWHYDALLGITYLFSLNRERADADLVLPPDSSRALVWQGHVISRQHFPLPAVP